MERSRVCSVVGVAAATAIVFVMWKRRAKIQEARNSGADIPVIDLAAYLKDPNSAAAKAEIAKVAKGLHECGCLVIKDPRVDESHNDTFIDMLERYFEQADGIKDARPDLSYQVGVTPEGTEVPRNHCARIAKELRESEKPQTLCPPEADPKWRFFWRVGPKPSATKYPSLNADPVVPSGGGFPEWPQVMDMWGSKMLAALEAVAGMAAEGLELPPRAFQDLMHCGPHLLAPTGSDFKKHGALGTVLAGYHYDLNFLTIHGKSKYPGLFVWLRDGRRVPVKVPPGHLLVQAGIQLERVTGGWVRAGFHEVVVSDATVQAIQRARAKGGQQSLWRVSSTLFGHVASDRSLEPLGKFATPEARKKYPPLDAGEAVMQELNAINLGVGFGNQARP